MRGKKLQGRTYSHFTLAILAAIKELGNHAWSLPLTLEMSKRLSRPIARSQVYRALLRLTQMQLITYVLGERITKCGRGGMRKIYTVEKAGEDLIASVAVSN